MLRNIFVLIISNISNDVLCSPQAFPRKLILHSVYAESITFNDGTADQKKNEKVYKLRTHLSHFHFVKVQHFQKTFYLEAAGVEGLLLERQLAGNQLSPK